MNVSVMMTAMLALLAPAAASMPGRIVTLSVPHALRSGGTAWIAVKVGAIGHAEIELTTVDGRPLGVISPYGVRPGSEAGTYTVPLPADAIAHGKVRIRLTLDQFGHAERAPTLQEVEDVRLRIEPAKP